MPAGGDTRMRVATIASGMLTVAGWVVVMARTSVWLWL